MAGGRLQYRHLGRSSAHRQALLRNLVTSLFKHESISTTLPKAKEAQRLAEKLITLGKKNTEASRRSAVSIFYVCCSHFVDRFLREDAGLGDLEGRLVVVGIKETEANEDRHHTS